MWSYVGISQDKLSGRTDFVFESYNFSEEEIIEIGSPSVSRLPIYIRVLGEFKASNPTRVRMRLEDYLIDTGHFDIVEPNTDGTYKLMFRENPSGDIDLFFFDAFDKLLMKGFLDSTSNRKIQMLKTIDSFVYVLSNKYSILGTQLIYLEKTNRKAKRNRLVLSDMHGITKSILVDNGKLNLYPRFSHDGGKISFVTLDENGYSLNVYSLSNGSVDRIPHSFLLVTGGAWLPDDKGLVLSSSNDGNTNIFAYYFADDRLVKLVSSSSIDTSATLAPNGTEFAYVSDRTGRLHIYRYSLLSKKSSRITLLGNYNTDPNWNPKYNEIVYNSLIGGVLELMIQKMDSDETFRITFDQLPSENPRWSPDGHQIAFTGETARSKKIFLIGKDGKYKRRITNSPTSIIEMDVSWSSKKLW